MEQQTVTARLPREMVERLDKIAHGGVPRTSRARVFAAIVEMGLAAWEEQRGRGRGATSEKRRGR